jgi:phosphotransferase system enzyme I (PtsI)
VGKLVFLGRTVLIPSEGSTTNPEAEWTRFTEGVARTGSKLSSLQSSVITAFSDATMQLFESYQAIVTDPTIRESVRTLVYERQVNAEWAVYEAFSRAKEVLARVPNLHIAEKVDDLENVKEMLLESLSGREAKMRNDLRDAIVVCESITPREVIALGQAGAAALVCGTGTRSSHVAIIARNISLPAVVGVGGFARSFKVGDIAVVDGARGVVEVSPTDESLRFYELKSQLWQNYGREVLERAAQPTVTRDGHALHVMANLESSDELPQFQLAHADGIGLFRLEFFYMMTGEFPDEEEIFRELARVRSGMGERNVVVRLLDAGGDKEIPAVTTLLRSKRLLKKVNPALGLRGVRILLQNPHVLEPQIAAIVRANAGGRVKILIPFVTSLDEVRAIKCQVRQVWQGLALRSERELPFPEIGIMIETPAAAMMIDVFANEVDFFSIGSNDLMQHGLAVDRTDGSVGSIYDWFHPAVLRMIQKVVVDASVRGVPVSLCGEMGSDFLAIELLVGLGLRTFSASIHAIPGVKEVIRNIEIGAAQHLVVEVLELRTSLEIRNRLQERFIERFGMELFALLVGEEDSE